MRFIFVFCLFNYYFISLQGKPEENGNSNANPHGHVLHVLDTPHHSHGTQPEDGSSTSGFVYPQPMNNKVFVLLTLQLCIITRWCFTSRLDSCMCETDLSFQG